VVTWTSDDTFVIADVEYVCRPLTDRFPSTPDRLCLVKDPWQVDWYEVLLRDVAPQRMIEIGIWDGASMALCAELVHPKTLVGIDNREGPSAALDEFISRRNFAASVHPHYGVDQADSQALDEIVGAEFGDEPLDLVVDDASHLLDPTRTSFNRLYPRLRPGGVYVIEDWPMHQLKKVESSLTLLIFEAMLAAAEAPATVANVSINRSYAVITRGDADLKPGIFDLWECLGSRARSLLARRASGVSIRDVPDGADLRRRPPVPVAPARWHRVSGRAVRGSSAHGA
jgi:methyltransferase family protein